jgi:hypothetical protein
MEDLVSGISKATIDQRSKRMLGQIGVGIILVSGPGQLQFSQQEQKKIL